MKTEVSSQMEAQISDQMKKEVSAAIGSLRRSVRTGTTSTRRTWMTSWAS